MAFFSQLRPLVRIAVALEQIAASLNYFATKDARLNGGMFFPGRKRKHGPDVSELLHTPDPATVDRIRAAEQEIIANRGYAYLDELESQDE